MYKVLLEDLEKSPNKILHYKFDGKIEELEECSLKADLDIKLLGDYVEIKGAASGSVILECDRCLTKYKEELDFDIDETYAKKSLYDEYSQELELKSGQFITDLNGAKEIDIYDLLYQSVILNLPNKKVCGINCNEGMFVSSEDMKNHDTRMDIFKNIRIENRENN